MAALHSISPDADQTPSLVIDLDDLTIGDLEDFEDIVGVPFEEAQQGNFRSIKALKAIVFLTMRKTDLTFTIEDARNVKVTSLKLGTDEDPTAAAGSDS